MDNVLQLVLTENTLNQGYRANINLLKSDYIGFGAQTASTCRGAFFVLGATFHEMTFIVFMYLE